MLLPRAISHCKRMGIWGVKDVRGSLGHDATGVIYCSWCPLFLLLSLALAVLEPANSYSRLLFSFR